MGAFSSNYLISLQKKSVTLVLKSNIIQVLAHLPQDLRQVSTGQYQVCLITKTHYVEDIRLWVMRSLGGSTETENK